MHQLIPLFLFLVAQLGCTLESKVDRLLPQFSGRVWFVAKDGTPHGSGTVVDPVDRLSRIEARVEPGDRVWFREGRYDVDRIQIRFVGRSDRWIEVAAYPGERVEIRGSLRPREKRFLFEAEEKENLYGLIDVRNASFVRVRGFDVLDAPQFGINVWNSDHIVVDDCRIRRTWSRALGGGGRHLEFSNNRISEAVLQNENGSVLMDASKGLRRYWSAAGATWYLPGGRRSEDVLWYRNMVEDSWGEGPISLHADRVRMIENQVKDTYSGLVYVDNSSKVSIVQNELFHSNRKRIRGDEMDVSPGIMIAVESYSKGEVRTASDIVIERNRIFNVSVGVGFWRDPSNRGAKNTYRNIRIEKNSVFNVSQIPILFPEVSQERGFFADLVIRNNCIESAQFGSGPSNERSILKLGTPDAWIVEDNRFLLSGADSARPNGKMFKRFARNKFVTSYSHPVCN